MSTQDVVFNGNSFVDNLNLLLTKHIQPVTEADLDSLSYMNTAVSGKTAAGFLSTIKTDANPFVDWDSFLQAWKNYSGDTSTTGLLNAFLADFKKQIGYVDGNPSGSDWYVLSEAVQGTGKGVTDATIQTFFTRSFGSFLSNYPYELVDTDSNPDTAPIPSNVGDATTAGTNFFTNWTKFMASSTDLQTATSASDPDLNGLNLSAFELTYTVFFPAEGGETAADVQNRFYARLKKFVDDEVKGSGGGSSGNGWFIPSRSFHTWFNDIRDEFITQSSKTSVEVHTTVTPESAKRVLVIDRVLRLLITITSTLQRISASQAQHLSFLTSWTDAYTNLVTDVPQFTQGQANPIGDGSKASKAFRNNDVNPHMQSILDKIKARRENVQDSAKQMQTTINSTQDAANQQTQLATSLLQQLSTILGQIFR